MSKFGNANYNGGKTQFVKRNRYKLKDGDNVYRILPPMGDLADAGKWSAFYNVVFGFKTTDGKHRPFQSPQITNRKSKMVEVHCAATDLIKKLKAQLDEAKRTGNKEQAAQLAKIVGDYPVMGVYSLNNDHYLNVVDRQGNVGQLELGHRAKLSLDNEIKRIRDTEGFDPLSADNGRFFNIRRQGKGLDTTVAVTVLKEKIDVPGVGKVDRDIIHTIDDALSDRLLEKKGGKWIYKEAANLAELFKRPTSEEVESIVKNVDILTGKSSGIDSVFGKSPAAAETVQEAQNEPEEQSAMSAEAAPAATPVPAVAASIAAPQTVVAQETKAAVKMAEAPAASSQKTTAEMVAAMTPEELMKQFGITF